MDFLDFSIEFLDLSMDFLDFGSSCLFFGFSGVDFDFSPRSLDLDLDREEALEMESRLWALWLLSLLGLKLRIV